MTAPNVVTAGAKRYHSATPLVANVVDEVTLDHDYPAVEVKARQANTVPIFFTADGASVPTVNGGATEVLDPGDALIVACEQSRPGASQVWLIASAAASYDLRGLTAGELDDEE